MTEVRGDRILGKSLLFSTSSSQSTIAIPSGRLGATVINMKFEGNDCDLIDSYGTIVFDTKHHKLEWLQKSTRNSLSLNLPAMARD